MDLSTYNALVTRANALDMGENNCSVVGRYAAPMIAGESGVPGGGPRILCPGNDGSGVDYGPQEGAVREFYGAVFERRSDVWGALTKLRRGINRTEGDAIRAFGFAPLFDLLRSNAFKNPVRRTFASDLFASRTAPFTSDDPVDGAIQVFRLINTDTAQAMGEPIGNTGADRYIGPPPPIEFNPAPISMARFAEKLASYGYWTDEWQRQQENLLRDSTPMETLKGLLFKATSITLNGGKPISLYVGLVNLAYVFEAELESLRMDGHPIPLIEDIINQGLETLADAPTAADQARRAGSFGMATKALPPSQSINVFAKSGASDLPGQMSARERMLRAGASGGEPVRRADPVLPGRVRRAGPVSSGRVGDSLPIAPRTGGASKAVSNKEIGLIVAGVAVLAGATYIIAKKGK